MKEIDPETTFIIKEKTGEDRSGFRDCSLAPTHGRCGLVRARRAWPLTRQSSSRTARLTAGRRTQEQTSGTCCRA